LELITTLVLQFSFAVSLYLTLGNVFKSSLRTQCVWT